MGFGARGTKLIFVGGIAFNCLHSDLMFQVPRIVKLEFVLVGKTLTNYFDLFAVPTAVVKLVVERVAKKPLIRLQKADDYLRFLG